MVRLCGLQQNLTNYVCAKDMFRVRNTISPRRLNIYCTGKLGQGSTKDLLQPRGPPNLYWEWGGPSFGMFMENEKFKYIQGYIYLFSDLSIFEPLKIFYGQKVAHMYIGKKEAILENVYAKY